MGVSTSVSAFELWLVVISRSVVRFSDEANLLPDFNKTCQAVALGLESRVDQTKKMNVPL
jgi:hypothetical protein